MIPGLSGCKLEFHINQKRVIKSSTESYNHRFIKQINKQKYFFEEQVCKTPKIYQVYLKQNQLHCEMEYHYGLNFIEFLMQANIQDLENLSHALFQLIQKELKLCSWDLVPRHIITNKVKNVLSSVPDLKLDSYFESIIPKIDSFLLPCGICHGDLTMSNIIFTEDIYFIDFLDTYIESPICDIAKIKQDLYWFWTYNLYTKSLDKVRVLHLMQWLWRLKLLVILHDRSSVIVALAFRSSLNVTL